MKVPLSYLPKAGKFQVQKSTIRFTAVGDLPGIRGTSFISHETLDDVADGIVKEIDRSVANAQEAKSKPYDFQFHVRVTSTNGYVFAQKPRVIKLRAYENAAAARAALKDPEQRAELQEEAERMKNGVPERREKDRGRKGPQRRDGDVSPDQFEKAFGFRGVEFGNYVTAAQRQSFLNETYDALMDLAGALGVPTETLSLNGSLAMAFGARGVGNRGGHTAAAHYEPVKTVINLTRGAGAGSLAHEWWHAVDNHINDLNAGRNTSELFTERNIRQMPLELPQDFHNALRAMLSSIRSTPYFKRMEELDRMRSKPYWSSAPELTARLFERIVVERLSDRGMVNDFLANIDLNGGAYPADVDMGGMRAPVNTALGFIERTFNPDGTGQVPDMPPLRQDALSRPLEPGSEWENANGLKRRVLRVDSGDNLIVHGRAR